jgi:ribonuclease G
MFGLLRRRPKDGREIIINKESLETRVVILDKGRLYDFKVEHPTEERIVGSIYKGVIQNLEDSLHAAFVDIGMRKNAFIHYWDMFPEDLARLEALEGDGTGGKGAPKRKQMNAAEVAKVFPVGSEIVVQVTKGPIGTKGPRVTANLSIPSRYFVLMPGSTLRGISRKIEDEKERKRLKKILARLPVPEGTGLIIRTAGSGARSTSFVRDLRGLLESWTAIQDGIANRPGPCLLYQEPDLVERVIRDSVTEDIAGVVVDSPEEYRRVQDLVGRIARRSRGRIKLYDGPVPIFQHYDLDRQIEDVFRRKVTLKSGGCIVVDETEALVAVDVNTGQHKGGASQEETILAVNLEAVEEVARQLRLRNIGGLIVLDLIDMRQRRHRNQVYQALKDALRDDKARTNILPISTLGLLEMTRQRLDDSVGSSMYSDCPYCRGRGSVKSPLSMSIELQRRLAEVLRRHAREGRSLALRVILHPAILARLREQDEDILVTLQSKFNGTLSFRPDPGRHVEEFIIQDAETNADLYVHHVRQEE